MSMLALGTFLFEIGTLPYQSLSRSTDYKFAEGERFGARASQQFIGPGSDKITLTGALYPGVAGSYSSMAILRAMATAGEAYVLVTGFGEILGNWSIRSIAEKQEQFFIDGAPRKSDFTIELARGDD